MAEWLHSIEELLPESKFWRRVIQTTIGGVLASIIVSAGGWLFGIIAWEDISALFGISVPLWLILALVVSVQIGFLIHQRYAQEKTEAEETPPHEEEFTEAIIEDIRWQWSWEDGEPSDLTPLCPECGMEMDYSDNYTAGVSIPSRTNFSVVECPSGHFRERWKDRRIGWVLNLAKREVERRVREQEWQNEQVNQEAR